MSDEKPKVVEAALIQAAPALLSAKEREERKALRRKKRQGRLMDAMLDVQEAAAEDVSLRKYIFLEDDELTKAGLTRQQIRKVRGWEESKRNAPFSLEASAQFVTSMLRRENDKGKVTINVENMNVGVQLPEKADETAKPIIIEVNPETK